MIYQRKYFNGDIENWNFPKPGSRISFYHSLTNSRVFCIFNSIEIFRGGPCGVFVILDLESESEIPIFTKEEFDKSPFPLNDWSYDSKQSEVV